MQAWVKCELKNVESGMNYDVLFPTESGRKLSLRSVFTDHIRRPAAIKQGEWGKGSLAVEMDEPCSGPWGTVMLPKVSEEGMEFVAVKKEDFGFYQEERAAPSTSRDFFGWDAMANATMESYVRAMRERLNAQTMNMVERVARRREAEMVREPALVARVDYTILPPGTVVRPEQQAVAQPTSVQRPAITTFDPDDPRHDPETCSLCRAYANARAANPSATGFDLGMAVQERLTEVR